jgi:hypothetical protein
MAGFPGLSRAARRAMARAGGFNTDNTLYHGTTADVDELQPGRGGLIYAAENDPGYASMFAGQRPGANVMPMYMRPGNQFDMVDNPEHRQRAIDLFNEKGGWANRAEMEGGYGPDDAQEFWTEMLGDDAPVRDSYLYDPEYDMDWEILDDPETDILYDLGQEFDSFRFKEDDDVIAQATADPSRFRSINAAFDPAERDSGNLLASAAPVGAVGAGMLAAGGSEESQAGSLAEDLLNQNQYDAQLARYMPQPERAAPEATRGGAWELAKMVGKGLAGDSLGGLSAIGGLLTGDSLEEALADLESVRGYFQGDGALSQEGMDTVEAGMNWWDQLPNEVAGTPYLAPKRWGEEFMRMPAVWGDVAYDATGSPVAGALAQMGPDLMMDVLPAAVPLAAARKASRLARRGM